MSGEPIIRARGLARTFKTKTGPVQAVAGVDFEVIPGEIVGLLGPNGAGKTTTLRMLTTLLEPTAGEAMIDGHDLARDPRDVRRSIGYVAQVGSAPSAGLRLGEELVTQARLQGMSKRAAEERVRELAPSLDLGGLEDRALLELSGGQRRRFDIAIGLMHSPPVIFLDEPTTGLDPQSRANLWEHISKLRRETGVSILLTTHYLEEADVLSDRILVMDHGRIVADDTPAALKARVHGDVIEVGVASADLERAEAATRAAVDAREISSGEDSLKVTVDEGAPVIARLLSALEAAGVSVGSVSIRRPSLDDVFLTLTGRSLREDSGEHDSDSEERAA